MVLLQTPSIFSISCFSVFFFLAIVPTTGIPSNFSNNKKSIEIPFFFASSNKLTQRIILGVISMVW